MAPVLLIMLPNAPVSLNMSIGLLLASAFKGDGLVTLLLVWLFPELDGPGGTVNEDGFKGAIVGVLVAPLTGGFIDAGVEVVVVLADPLLLFAKLTPLNSEEGIR